MNWINPAVAVHLHSQETADVWLLVGSVFQKFLRDTEDQQRKLIYSDTTVDLQILKSEQKNNQLHDNKPKWLTVTASDNQHKS